MEDLLCRICLEECSQLKSLFEKCEDSTPYEKLKNRLKIEMTDDGPSHICSGCFLELENCLIFLEKCEKSNKILVSRFRTEEALSLQSDCFEQEIRPTNQQSQIESVTDDRNVTSRQSEQQSNRKPCVECGSRRICEHKPPTVYTCQICQKIFTRKFNYNIHVKRHLGRRDWPCESCGAAQVSRWLARTHCAARRRHSCPVAGCLRSYTSVHNLNTHIRSHTGERPYVCKECGKRFTCRSTLNDHTRIHTGVKPYMCSICGARFATNKLSAHLRTHEDRPRRPNAARDNTTAQENSTHCCMHCSARYTHKQSLNRHVRKHHSSSLQKGNDVFCSVNINDLQEC